MASSLEKVSKHNVKYMEPKITCSFFLPGLSSPVSQDRVWFQRGPADPQSHDAFVCQTTKVSLPSSTPASSATSSMSTTAVELLCPLFAVCSSGHLNLEREDCLVHNLPNWRDKIHSSADTYQSIQFSTTYKLCKLKSEADLDWAPDLYLSPT